MCTRCVFLGGLAALVAAPAAASARSGDPAALEIAIPEMRRIADTVWLGRLTARVWIHTTTRILTGVGWYPANGVIVVDGKESLMIDTSYNDRDAATILDAWRRTGQPPITRALATHFHSDRTGGIGTLKARGIPTFGNPLTIGLALDDGLHVPRPMHELQRRPQRLGSVEVFYPGSGHTLDNVVAWIPSDRVLFGGCLVKATTAPDLGYVDDGDLTAYPGTIRRIMHAYAPLHVIPGHGTIAGDSLAHTLAMAEAAAPR